MGLHALDLWFWHERQGVLILACLPPLHNHGACIRHNPTLTGCSSLTFTCQASLSSGASICRVNRGGACLEGDARQAGGHSCAAARGYCSSGVSDGAPGRGRSQWPCPAGPGWPPVASPPASAGVPAKQPHQRLSHGTAPPLGHKLLCCILCTCHMHPVHATAAKYHSG